MELIKAWKAWLEDNKKRFPEKRIPFIKSVYNDGFIDGQANTRHNEIMEELKKIRKGLARGTN